MQLLDPTGSDFWVGAGVSILCGSIIGLERQLRGKPIGVRTSILICLSVNVFLELGHELVGPDSVPTRVLGQVVTGVGFLGAGVILSRGNVVTGVTTAAVIWMLAAIGAAIGLDQYRAAIALASITVVVLVGVDLLERSMGGLRRGDHGPSQD